MSEDEQEINIVKFFKSELELIYEALAYKVNHKTWTQSEDEERRKHEDLFVRLVTGDIVTKISVAKAKKKLPKVKNAAKAIGGKARAKKLTPEQRIAIAKKAANARWGTG